MDKIFVKHGFLANQKVINDSKLLKELRKNNKISVQRLYDFSNINYKTIFKKSLRQRISLLENIKNNYKNFIFNLKTKIIETIEEISKVKIKTLENEIKLFKDLSHLKIFNHNHLSQIEEIMNNSLTENYLHNFDVVENMKKLYNQEFYSKKKNKILLDHYFSLKNQGIVTCCVLSKDEKFLFVGCKDGLIRKWKVPSFQEEMMFYGHKDSVREIFSDEEMKRVVSVDEDCIIKLWKYNKDLCYKQIKIENFSCMSLNTVNRILTVLTNNCSICLVDYPNMKKIKELSLMFNISSILEITSETFFSYSTGDDKLFHKFKITPEKAIISLDIKYDTNFTMISISEKKDFFMTLDESKKLSKIDISTFYVLEEYFLEITNTIRSIVLYDNDNSMLVIEDIKSFSYNLDSRVLTQTEAVSFKKFLFPKKHDFFIGFTQTGVGHKLETSRFQSLKKLTENEIYDDKFIDNINFYKLCRRSDKTCYIWNYQTNLSKDIRNIGFVFKFSCSGDGKFLGLLIGEMFVQVIKTENFETFYEVDVKGGAVSLVLNYVGSCFAIFNRKIDSMSVEVYGLRKDSPNLCTFKIGNHVKEMKFSSNGIYLLVLNEFGAFLLFNLVTEDRIWKSEEGMMSVPVKSISLIHQDLVIEVIMKNKKKKFIDIEVPSCWNN